MHQKTYPTITTSRGVFARGTIMVKRQYSGSRQYASPPNPYIMENDKAPAWMNKKDICTLDGGETASISVSKGPRLPHSPASTKGACHFLINKTLILPPILVAQLLLHIEIKRQPRPRYAGLGSGDFHASIAVSNHHIAIIIDYQVTHAICLHEGSCHANRLSK